MSKIKRCVRCKGSKITMELGGLEKKCKVCNGVGYQDSIDESDVDSFLSGDSSESTTKVTYKKKGRPKKEA